MTVRKRDLDPTDDVADQVVHHGDEHVDHRPDSDADASGHEQPREHLAAVDLDRRGAAGADLSVGEAGGKIEPSSTSSESITPLADRIAQMIASAR